MPGKGNGHEEQFGSRVRTVLPLGMGSVWVVGLPNGMLGLEVLLGCGKLLLWGFGGVGNTSLVVFNPLVVLLRDRIGLLRDRDSLKEESLVLPPVENPLSCIVIRICRMLSPLLLTVYGLVCSSCHRILSGKTACR